ncbi:MAG: hypothetical protein MHM6MM_002081 [Cercozoa sp. M6MM]
MANQQCVVCLQNKRDVAVCAPCYHSFCRICLRPWFRAVSPARCPLCRDLVEQVLVDFKSRTEFLLRTPDEFVNEPVSHEDRLDFPSILMRRKLVYALAASLVPRSINGEAATPAVLPEETLISASFFDACCEFLRREIRILLGAENENFADAVSEEYCIQSLQASLEQTTRQGRRFSLLQHAEFCRRMRRLLRDDASTLLRELRYFVSLHSNLSDFDALARYMDAPIELD